MMIPGSEQTASGRRLLAAALVLTLIGLACLGIDERVSLGLVREGALHSAFAQQKVASRALDVPGDLRRLVTLSEVFAHGTGVAAIAVVVLVLKPGSARDVRLIVLCCAAAGLTAILLKYAIPRTRPLFHDFESGVLATFRRPFGQGYTLQSTPSAHAATAAALAISLTVAFPRGRVLFTVFAVLAAMQRVESGAHFLSDVCWGAAIGCVMSVIVVRLTCSRHAAPRAVLSVPGGGLTHCPGG